MIRTFFPILLLILFSGIARGATDSTTSGLFLELDLHQGMDDRASFMLPSIGWERGRHRAQLGAVFGATYVHRAGSKGTRWTPSPGLNMRGAAFSYDLKVWQANSTVSVRSGADIYYLRDGSQVKKGDEDPHGDEYGEAQRAARRLWGLAPALMVELDLGSGFALALGLQPLRYQWSTYRWDPDQGKGNEGDRTRNRFLRQKFQVIYRP